MEAPKSSIFFGGIFHEINHPAIGVSTRSLDALAEGNACHRVRPLGTLKCPFFGKDTDQILGPVERV